VETGTEARLATFHCALEICRAAWGLLLLLIQLQGCLANATGVWIQQSALEEIVPYGTNHSWETIMKRLAFMLALGAIMAHGAAQTPATNTLNGYISDSKCGAMHMDNGLGCVNKCIEDGYLPVFVDAQKKVWAIENPYAVKGYYGYNVKIEGAVNLSEKSIHVDKITKTGGVLGGMKDGMPM
jgi:hypothetical protein